MPIRINLLAEAQAAEEARRKDPVKRAILMAGGVIALMILWGVFEFSQTMVARSELGREEKSWKALEPSYNELLAKQAKTVEQKKRLAALHRLAVNRFLWASTLNAFQMCYVDNMPFQLLRGTHQYSTAEPVLGKGNVVVKPATATERITLQLELKDFGVSPSEDFERFRRQIFSVPYFRERLQSAEAVRLRNISQQANMDPVENKPYYTLQVECLLAPREFKDE